MINSFKSQTQKRVIGIFIKSTEDIHIGKIFHVVIPFSGFSVVNLTKCFLKYYRVMESTWVTWELFSIYSKIKLILELSSTFYCRSNWFIQTKMVLNFICYMFFRGIYFGFFNKTQKINEIIY